MSSAHTPKANPPDTLGVSGSTHGPDSGILAEIASFQLEYTAVAAASRKKEYYEKVCIITRFMRQITERSQVARVNAALATGNLTKTGGMFPKTWSLKTGRVFDGGVSSTDRENDVVCPDVASLQRRYPSELLQTVHMSTL